MKKSKFILIGFLVIILIFTIIWITHNKNKSYETTDTGQYKEMKKILKGKVFSGLDVFPEEIINNKKSKNYYLQIERKTLDYSVEVYLECEYEKEEFRKEKERLSKIQAIYEKYQLCHSIVEDMENFQYPAYVMVYQDNYTYEYALIDEKKARIIYIYLQHANYSNLKTDPMYLDKKYKEYMQSGESRNGYNQYGFSSSECEASPE